MTTTEREILAEVRRIIADAEYWKTAFHNSAADGIRVAEKLDRAIAAVRQLRAALRVFAEVDECGLGFSVGGGEHESPCWECENILAARAALAATVEWDTP